MNVFKGRTGYIVWPQGETGINFGKDLLARLENGVFDHECA